MNLTERDGQRYAVIRDYLSPYLASLARRDVGDVRDTAFDRYESAFEAKLTLRDKSRFDRMLARLEATPWLEELSALFGVQLIADRWRHYAGVFRYLPGDHLGVHVDAGIHPATGLRKHVTAVLYLGGSGPLELWSGVKCSEREPYVTGLIEAIEPKPGTLVLFENNDHAWHGAARNDSDDERLVLTVSYLSGQIDAFANRRQRAFFVPRPTEEWDAETYALRDLRADSTRFQEAYRSG